MKCADCGQSLPSHARFCSRCGRRIASAHVQSVPHTSSVREEPALVRSTPARRAADFTSATSSARPTRTTARALPAAVVALGCGIGVAAMWSILRLDDIETAAAAREAAQDESARTTAQRVSAGAERFSARQALRGLYGNYDPVVDGAYWTVSGAPRAWAHWNGRRVAIKPLVSRSNSAGTRHVLVTSSVDVTNGLPMKQGTACADCKSVLGAALYEVRDNEWRLVAHHPFVAVEGAWGAPPDISVEFLEEGRVALGVRRTRTTESRARGPEAVLLVDADRVSRRAVARPRPEPPPRQSAPARRSNALAVSTFPSSADGP